MNNEYKKFAEEFTKEAGGIIREGFYKNLERATKEDNSLITEYDNRINDLLIKKVKENFPDHAVHGEESGYVGEEGSKYVWVCDPIDGTKAFITSVPLITFMLSLVCDGETILSIIYDPILDRVVTAEKGKGILFNNEPCSQSGHLHVANSFIGFSVNMKYKFVNMFEVWTELNKNKAQFSYVHVGMSGLLLASGNIDAVVMPFFGDYEFQTLRLLFDEGGFVTTNLLGEPIVNITDPKQGFVVAKPELHKEIIKIINPLTKDLKL